MNRISIAKRLYIGLGLIVLVGVAMTLAALIGLSRIKGQWEAFEKGSLVRLDLVLDATRKFGAGVHAFKNVVLRGQDYESKALVEMNAIDAIARRYEGAQISQDEKKYLDALTTGISNYKLAIQKVANLKRGGAAIGDVDAAVKGVDRPVEDAIEGLRTLILREVEASSALFQERLQENKQILLIGLFITACFGGLLGYSLVRSIKSGLAVANATIDNVAKGDFSQGIDTARRDEIGQLLSRTAHMTTVLKAFLAAQRKIAREHNEEGRTSSRIPDAEFEGAYSDMARNLNAVVQGHIDVQNRFTELMGEYAGGAFHNRMPLLPGERKAISDAAEGVRAGLEASAKAAQYNARVKAALDYVGNPVGIADADGTMLYLNNAFEDMLRRNETTLRRQIPNFDPEKAIGASAGVLFSDPRAAIARLRMLTKPEASHQKLAGRDFLVVDSPVFDERGDRIGFSGQWTDITEQLAAEREVAALVEAAAAGDFSKRIAEAGKSGFMLQMSQGLNAILCTSERALGEIGCMLESLAQGDLSKSIEADYKGVFAKLKENSNATIERLRAIVSQIREASNSINSAAREIATGNNDLAHRTEEQATSLEETASSLEELASTVRQNAGNAQEASGWRLKPRKAPSAGAKW